MMVSLSAFQPVDQVQFPADAYLFASMTQSEQSIDQDSILGYCSNNTGSYTYTNHCFQRINDGGVVVFLQKVYCPTWSND